MMRVAARRSFPDSRVVIGTNPDRPAMVLKKITGLINRGFFWAATFLFAVGLLYSYDPAVQLGRDRRPRKHYIVNHGRSYQQMLNTLLLEVNTTAWDHSVEKRR